MCQGVIEVKKVTMDIDTDTDVFIMVESNFQKVLLDLPLAPSQAILVGKATVRVKHGNDRGEEFKATCCKWFWTLSTWPRLVWKGTGWALRVAPVFRHNKTICGLQVSS